MHVHVRRTRRLLVSRNLGDRGGEARTLNNLGLVADAQGDYETAREYFEAGLEISREIGAIWPTLQILDNLVYTRDFKESEESAIEWCRTALSIIDDSGLDLTDEREIFESYLDELQGSGE